VTEADAIGEALIGYLHQKNRDNSHLWPDAVFDFEPLEFRFEDLREDGSLLPLTDVPVGSQEKSNA
jgi:hypothetical protein